jgi:molybdate-binding protein
MEPDLPPAGWMFSMDMPAILYKIFSDTIEYLNRNHVSGFRSLFGKAINGK